jgi:hypothetical protein
MSPFFFAFLDIGANGNEFPMNSWRTAENLPTQQSVN